MIPDAVEDEVGELFGQFRANGFLAQQHPEVKRRNECLDDEMAVGVWSEFAPVFGPINDDGQGFSPGFPECMQLFVSGGGRLGYGPQQPKPGR